MHLVARSLPLLAAACLAMSAAPALALTPGATAPAGVSSTGTSALTADGDYEQSFDLTLDWNAQHRAGVPLSAANWTLDALAPAIVDSRYYFRVDAQGQPYVEFRYDAATQGWLYYNTPASFDVTFSNVDDQQQVHRYRATVTVANLPQAPQPPAVEDIPLPTIIDPVSNVDLAELWDGGDPFVDGTHVSGAQIFDVVSRQQIPEENVEAYFTAHPLNVEMAKYFRIKVVLPEGDPMTSSGPFGLEKKVGAPPLPYRYWDNDWFNVTYTVHGRVEAPGWPGVYRQFSEEHTARFAAPGYKIATASSRTIRFIARGGTTSWNGVKLASAKGLTAGTLRLELLPVPKAVTSRFDVLLTNPPVSYSGGGPRVGIRPRTTRIARSAAPFTLHVRASALNRAGVRVYAGIAAWTVKRY